MSFFSITRIASYTSYVVRAAAFLAVLFLTSATNAVTFFWDANGSLAGTGTWDLVTANWNPTTVASDPNVTWNPNDGTLDASFGGNPGAGVAGSGLGGTNGQITVSGTVNVKSLIMAATVGNYSLYGGGINISDPTNSIVMNTNTSGAARAQVIASPISGTNITVVANGAFGNINSFLTLGAPGTGATNTFTGDLIFGGSFTPNATGFSQININNPTALPPTATVRMKRGLSQLLFTAGGVSGTTAYTATFNNNIILNDGGSGIFGQSIGASEAATLITLGGVMSGNATLTFQVGNGGGNGTIVLANHSTYTGNTVFNSNTQAVLRLGINDALPVDTTFIVNRGAAFDMAGFNQRVGGLTNNGANVAAITNTHATNLSTLTIDGNVIGTYPGLVGASISGSNDNIALALAPTNTGTLTLNRGQGSTYSGGTTINGGKLIAANDSSTLLSATGSGPVAVNSGGTLGGGGGVAGAITVASGGHIAPSGVFNNGTTTATNPIGALTAFGSASLGSGSMLDIDLGAPAPAGGTSDRLAMPNATALTVPAAANSIGINLGDSGGAAGNGTYVLISFQAGQYTGSTNASQFFTNSLPTPNSLNGATIAYHLADDTNTIRDGTPALATRIIAQVTGGPNALLWTGTAGGNWEAANNFTNLGTASPATFANNDNVRFDDTGANTDPITIAAGGVQPNVVTINNSSAVYTFTGGDIKGSSLGGGGGLFLGGTGAVTINSNYTAAGPIVSNKSGTGTTLVNGNITAATGVTVNGGTLTLAGTNTYTGSNTVNGGTLAVGADFNLGAVPGVPTANSIVLDSGALKTTTSFTLNSNRGITTNASNSVINNDPSTTLTYGGVISGTGGVTQTGGGTLTLSGANTYAGATTVTNGHMVVSGAAAKLGGGNVTVSGANAGTFLTISSGVTNAIADTAILSLAGGGTAGVADQGYIELGAGLNELIGTLLLNNAAQAFGTYGSTASSATFKNDEFFSGSGIVTVGMIPGDYNGDGKVDAADYVVWRDNPNAFGGDPGGYNTWRANFGAGAPATGSSLGAESAVPEPTTLLLILVMICSTLSVRRGRR